MSCTKRGRIRNLWPMNKKVLAICGSVRAQSTNKQYIELIARLAEEPEVLRGGEGWEVSMFEGLAGLPAFNPDIVEPPPDVADFYAKVAGADGVLICTPEYAMGPPGVLKNAIDWTVGVSAFSHRRVFRRIIHYPPSVP